MWGEFRLEKPLRKAGQDLADEEARASREGAHLFEYWTEQIESGDSYHDRQRWRQAEHFEPDLPLLP